MPFSTLLYATLLYPTLRYLFLPYTTLLYPRTHTVHVVDTHTSHVYTGLNKEPSSHSPAAYMYLIQYNMYMYTYTCMLTHSTLETSHSVHLLLLSHSKNRESLHSTNYHIWHSTLGFACLHVQCTPSNLCLQWATVLGQCIMTCLLG